MTGKDILRQVVEFNHMVTQYYVSDLTDAELLVRSVPGSNHIAWQMGHMITSTQHMLNGLGQAALICRWALRRHIPRRLPRPTIQKSLPLRRNILPWRNR